MNKKLLLAGLMSCGVFCESHANNYELIFGTFSWQEAQADAQSRGGHLATVTSDEEWNLISNSLGFPYDSAFWIGGSDADVEGEWTWVTGETWDYTRWAPGEPSGFGVYGEEDYLAVYGYLDGQWNDAQGHHIGFAFDGYILEMENQTPVPETGVPLWFLFVSLGAILSHRHLKRDAVGPLYRRS